MEKIYSQKGQEVLTKSTISNIPTYFVSPLVLASVIQRNILRDSVYGLRKFHLVGKLVQPPKGGRVLRVKTLINKAVLGKWLWRFGTE